MATRWIVQRKPCQKGAAPGKHKQLQAASRAPMQLLCKQKVLLICPAAQMLCSRLALGRVAVNLNQHLVCAEHAPLEWRICR